ncbi:MAG TPA: protein kinase [Pyrinomonadaceae bacterium]
MTAQHWQQIKEIFQTAIELASGERAAFINKACAGDEALRREVEKLIRAHEEDGSFIDAPAYEVAAGWLADEGAHSLTGQQINHYKMMSQLGAGGMGEVYLAQDTKLGRRVALKLLPASFTNDEDRLHRFQQEARTASALNHPNILTIYEIGEAEGRQYIATELIEGATLREHLTVGQMELNDALDIILQVASALAAAHEVGIVHRDIKPENIMLRRDSIVKVLDFGLAKLSEIKAASAGGLEAPTRMRGNTSPGMVMGTVNYMSPEQARGLHVDERTDIWSLGVVLYEMLAGSAPFKGETPTDVTVSILEREPQPLATFSEDMPAELDWIVKKALRKDRDERYQTVREMLGDLRGIKQDLDFEAKLERTAMPERAASDRAAPALKSADSLANTITNKSVVIPTDEIKGAHAPSVEIPSGKVKENRVPIYAALAVIALAALGFAFYKFFLQSKKATVFQAASIARLTNHGKAITAAVSPDGKYFVYALTDAGKQSIWLRQISASNDTQIVPPAPVGVFGITFSRDGNNLYYIIKQNDAGTLYKIPVLGGTPVKVLEKIDSPVAFSPDGKQLAFVRGDFPSRGESGLFIANADGSEIREIAARKSPNYFYPIFFTGPSWSPDGRLLACAMMDTNSGYRVAVINVADGTEQVLTQKPWRQIGRVEWLPEGNSLLMIAQGDSETVMQVWNISYPDGEARKVTNDLNGYRTLSLTADGSRLMTIQLSGIINMWIVNGNNSERAVKLPSAGSGQLGDASTSIQLPVGNVGYLGGDTSISWTPDGKIVFTSASGKQGDIWIMDADGSNRKQLTASVGNNQNPEVSPDGRYIIFTSDRSGRRNVWRMTIDGGDARQLTSSLVDFLPSVSPDNQWVFYTSLNEGKATLWKVPLAGGTPVQIIDREGYNPVVSPDGRWLAYLYTEAAAPDAPPNRIAVIPFEGGDPVKTFEIPPGLGGARTILHWSKDGHALLYTVIINNVSNIWSQPLEGGAPIQVTNFKEHSITAFDWSRDGKTLAVSRGILIRDAVLISNAK